MTRAVPPIPESSIIYRAAARFTACLDHWREHRNDLAELRRLRDGCFNVLFVGRFDRLKGGDVVLAVDGRTPESPSHLLRILRSYEESESFKAEVLRNRKRVSVEGRLGDKAREQ